MECPHILYQFGLRPSGGICPYGCHSGLHPPLRSKIPPKRLQLFACFLIIRGGSPSPGSDCLHQQIWNSTRQMRASQYWGKLSHTSSRNRAMSRPSEAQRQEMRRL